MYPYNDFIYNSDTRPIPQDTPHKPDISLYRIPLSFDQIQNEGTRPQAPANIVNPALFHESNGPNALAIDTVDSWAPHLVVHDTVNHSLVSMLVANMIQATKGQTS